MSNVANLSRLTFIRRTTMGKHPKAIYRCACGVEKEIIMHSVTSGNTVSCGCYHKERITKHGLYKHPLYQVWADMKDRCENEKAENYGDYGAIGVKVCDQWVNDFKVFHDWCISNGWRKGLQVDKDIKGSKIYSPDTCVIATSKENNNAKRNNRLVEFQGEIKTMSAWAEQFGIKPYTLWRRLKGTSSITDKSIFNKPRFKAAKGLGKYKKKKT